ncbi:MAG: ThuA domain-containing protein [Candidatus Bathyarchaeia archaeon]
MKSLLMVTHSAGFKHDYLPTAKKVVEALGRQSKLFKVVVTENCTVLNAGELERFDAVLFATSGELPMPDKAKMDFINSIKAGKGFVGVHNAADTFHNFPAYGEMLGAYFVAHPWAQEVTVKVEDRNHPATRHLPSKFKVKEEIYTFKNWSRNRTHTLISLDNASVDLSKGTRTDHDYALCWCHNYGKGKVFYTGFGHFMELWREGWFQNHLLNGILWVINLTV